MRSHKAEFFMHGDGPQTQTLKGAVPGKRLGLRACLILTLGAGMVCAAALCAPASGAKPTGAQAKEAAPEDFVGTEACATCHEEVATGFASNAHRKLAETHGKTGVTGEGCHGAGRAHVESGGEAAKIFNPAKASVKEVDAMCLSCHRGEHQNFDRSSHGEGNISCVSCHDIHSSKDEALLKAPQPTLCYQCHTDIKPLFSMPFNHKVNEGLVKCTDCHDPHGAYEKKNLKSAAQRDVVCVKCHTEKAGRRAESAPDEPREREHDLPPVPLSIDQLHLVHAHRPVAQPGNAISVMRYLPHSHSRLERQQRVL